MRKIMQSTMTMWKPFCGSSRWCQHLSVHKRSYVLAVEAEDLPQNAFSEKLSPLGFNYFLIFVFDLMHEFELGVWKALFIHLLRILQAEDKNLIHELDRQYVGLST